VDAILAAPEADTSKGRLARGVVTRLGWLLASGPALFLGLVLLHALHVRLFLGRWPIVYRDTPQSLLLWVHEYGLIMPTFYLSLFGVPFWAVVGAVFVALGLAQGRSFVYQLGLMVTGIGGLALLVALDPTGYVEWFLD
jgi:hypothetical protein